MEKLFIETMGLTKTHLETFMKIMFARTLKKKEYLIREGSVCNFVGIVDSGILRSHLTVADEELNNDFYFDNTFISAYSSFLTQQPTNCNIQALTAATIHYITREQLENLTEQDPAWLKLSKYVSDSFFIRKCKRESSFLKHTAAERLEVVLKLYPGIEQHVSQYHIASYLGIKPESLSRIKLLTYINK